MKRVERREKREKKTEGHAVRAGKQIVAHGLVPHEDDDVVNRNAVKANERIFLAVL